MKVKDIINKKVHTAHPDMQFRELWSMIFQKRVNAIPVIDKKLSLLGIISKEDILQKLYPDLQEFVENIESLADFEDMEKKISDLAGLKAKDIMCRTVVFARPETPVMRALSRMIVRGVNQLPVLDDRDCVIGVVTKGDVFYALFQHHLKSKIGGGMHMAEEPTVKKPSKKRSSRRK